MNSDLVLFYDGCHKIYYCQSSDTERIAEMRGYGYEVETGDFWGSLKDKWQQSCGLRFVQPADTYDNEAPQIEQGKSNKLHSLSGLRKQLKEYYGYTA